MNKYNYKFEYASSMLSNNTKEVTVSSSKKLTKGCFYIIEKEGQGYFIARVGDMTSDDASTIYHVLSQVDMTGAFDIKQKRERREYLASEMTRMKKEIDERNELKKYADMDETFNALLTEYDMLGGGK